jgi:bla regulator protein BlaR1
MNLYLPALANHLWQSTLFAVAAIVLALTLRQNPARFRYQLWLAASLKFLFPFALLIGAGSHIELRSTATVTAPMSAAVEVIGQPFAQPAPQPVRPVASKSVPLMIFLVWISGSLVVLFRWWINWRRLQLVLRGATPVDICAPVRVLSSRTSLEPGIFGVFRPVLLLPEGIADRLNPAQFAAVLAHEFCHVRRRDNLAVAAHMTVEVLFWFHPLVWWIGKRLIEERENACDEAVLRMGNAPATYAASILSVCKFYCESPLACAAGVSGSDLKKRIESIMSKRIRPELSSARKLILAIAGVAAIVCPLVIGVAQAPLKFEVASIKPTKNDSGTGGRGGASFYRLEVLPKGGLKMSGVTLKGLIAFAYGIDEKKISGGPNWINSEAYDIIAKPENSDPQDLQPNTITPGTPGWERLQQRAQALLAERFHLAIHKDSKDTSGYMLVQAKAGSKLKESPDPGRPRTRMSAGQINGQNGTMYMLATVLSQLVGSPVMDRTGLTGAYDYKLEYGQDAVQGMPDDVPGPSIFTALQEQLGLKLEKVHATIDTIVIEHAEKLSEN